MTTKQRALNALAVMLLTGSSVPLAIADSLPRAAITTAQISGALRQSGLSVTESQLEPLCTVTAQQPHPRLTVASIEPLDESSAKARMQCEHASICLPFYVVVHWQEADAARVALTQFHTSAPQRRRLRPEEVLVREGAGATLVYEGKHLRMTLPVTCLQSGARGQHVRVISKDRRKIYLARVVGPGVVTSATIN
jgi:hypothetical protein